MQLPTPLLTMNKRFPLNIVLLLCVLSGYGQSKNFIDQPYVETTAFVDTLVTPDEIYLNIIISEKDTKGKTSVEEQEAQMEKTLKALGINTKEDLTLNDLASNFKKYFLKGQDVLKSKVYSLKVHDAITAGKVILALEKIEISNVLLDRTEFSRIEQLKLELKSKAIVKARKQAEYMTSPLNQKVGAAIHISDQSDNYPVGPLQGRSSGIMIRGYAAKEKEFTPADIEFEKIKVESNVFVKFKLEL
jgi:uncharacterized protein YggE